MLTPCEYPIAVMSFNRPDYLRSVLLSLKEQSMKIQDEQVFLFQDSVEERGSIETFDTDLQNQCVCLFKSFFPSGNIIKSRYNLGVALNFDRAERFFFEVLNVECAFFLEDDLELGKDYLLVLHQLANYAILEPKIAYVAAYGNHNASLESQIVNQDRLIQLEHKWGFALTQRQWRAQKPIVDGYLKIVSERPYRDRDHKRIHEYFIKLGYDSPGSSQDAAKDVASLVLGTIKINTFACFGRYIGKKGLHFTPELFYSGGYDSVAMFDGNVPEFHWPSSNQIEALLESQRNNCRVNKGSLEFAGLSLIPYMSESESELFIKTVRGSRSYLEFGAGGSTVLAAALAVPYIVSVDSDAKWLEKVAQAPELANRTLILEHVDIGPVGDWGVPVNSHQANKWPNYYLTVWKRVSTEPDVVMIDGRFRVATAIQALARLGSRVKVMIHDFGDREHYNVILNYCEVIDAAGSLAVLRLKSDADQQNMLICAAEHALDYR